MDQSINSRQTKELPVAGEWSEKQRDIIVSEAVKHNIAEFEQKTQFLLLSNYNKSKSGEVLIENSAEIGLTDKKEEELLTIDLDAYIREYKVQLFPSDEIPEEIQPDIKNLKKGAAYCRWRELRVVKDETGVNLQKKLGGGFEGMTDGGFRVFFIDKTGGVSVVDIMHVCSKSYQRWERRVRRVEKITIEAALKKLLKEKFGFDPDVIPYTTIDKITKIINTVLDEIKQKEQVETANNKKIDEDTKFDF